MRKKVLIALLFVSMLSCKTVSPIYADAQNVSSTNKTMAQKHFRNALALSLAGYLDRALTEYSQAINLDPYFALAYNNLGYIYRQKGKLDLAIENYNKALSIKPNDDTAYSNLASCYDAKGDLNKAIEMFYKALEIDPGSITLELALEKILKKKAKLEGKTLEELQVLMAAKYPISCKKPSYDEYADLLNDNIKPAKSDNSEKVVVTSTTAQIKKQTDIDKNKDSAILSETHLNEKTKITDIPVVKKQISSTTSNNSKAADNKKSDQSSKITSKPATSVTTAKQEPKTVIKSVKTDVTSTSVPNKVSVQQADKTDKKNSQVTSVKTQVVTTAKPKDSKSTVKDLQKEANKTAVKSNSSVSANPTSNTSKAKTNMTSSKSQLATKQQDTKNQASTNKDSKVGTLMLMYKE